MHPHYRGVALLLSLGSLPIACNDKDPATTPGTTDTGNDPTPDPDSGSTTPVDPTTSPDGSTETATFGTTQVTTEDPDTTTESPATTFVTTESMTVPPPTEGTTTTPDFPPPQNPACQGYVDHFLMCNPRYAEYAGYAGYSCDQYIMYGMQADGQACADAIEALFACFNALPCEPPEEPCAQQEMAIEAACPSFGEEPSTSSSDTVADTGSSG